MHKQFGHATATKPKNLLRNSGHKNKILEKDIDDVCQSCETCCKLRRPPSRPIVSLPMAERFIDLIAMDLKSFNGVYFLVIVDYATRYCAASVINDKKPETIIQGIFTSWISLFGSPKKLLSDNGGEFNNSQMRQLGETFNIRLMTTAAESPWSNGVCERLNGVLGDSVRKIMNDSSCNIKICLIRKN